MLPDLRYEHCGIVHPFYGVERLAIHLGWGEAGTRRIGNLASIVIPTASKKHRYRSGKPEIPPAPNILGQYAVFKDESRQQYGMNYQAMTQAGAWAQDFTYLKFQHTCGTTWPLSSMLRPGR